MSDSIDSVAVRVALDAAKVAGQREVQVGPDVVHVPTPYPSPADWRDVWVYHLLLDRFNNPDRSPASAWNRRCDVFQGGTFNGVRAKLDYLQELGVGAVWISPCMKNCQYDNFSYHAYGIQDFLRLDPRFASAPGKEEQEFRALVAEAHARGIYVIADIVLNHAGNVFAYRCDGDGHCERSGGHEAGWRDDPYAIQWRDETGHGRWTEPPDDPANGPPISRDALVWPKELQRNDFFRRRGLGGEEGGDFASLKELVTASHTVRDVLIRAHQYFIARYDVDGFRIDTLKFIERDFARTFGNAIREFGLEIGKKNFLTYGEVWDSEEKIAEFVGRHVDADSDLVGVDAALDFPLFDRLPSMAKGFIAPSQVIDVFQRRRRAQRNVISSHGEASKFFITFLDNHDQKRRFRSTTTNQYDDQITLGLACLFTLQGIPCVYYGTEQGLNGADEAHQPNAGYDDWMVREALWGKPGAFDGGHPICQVLRRLTKARAANPALRYGRQYFRPISGNRIDFGISCDLQGVLAYSRILNDEEVVVIANTNAASDWSGYVVIDAALNADGAAMDVLLTNKSGDAPADPSAAQTAHNVNVHEVDGRTTHGPARIIQVRLRPMEVQIIGRRATP